MLVSASILSADFSDLTNELSKIENSDFIHFDVMDGHFVPNISFGPHFVKCLRERTKIPFDVHLMISEPYKYIEQFVDAGADVITVHAESELKDSLEQIKNAGIKRGMAFNPETPIEKIVPFLHELDWVLVMSVHPGFSGQKFISSSLSKIAALAERREREKWDFKIAVDGGINSETAKEAKDAGADVLVASSFIFSSSAPSTRISELHSI